jgi:hypothetical protein
MSLECYSQPSFSKPHFQPTQSMSAVSRVMVTFNPPRPLASRFTTLTCVPRSRMKRLAKDLRDSEGKGVFVVRTSYRLRSHQRKATACRVVRLWVLFVRWAVRNRVGKSMQLTGARGGEPTHVVPVRFPLSHGCGMASLAPPSP